jgi:hypothetical protein
MKKFPPSEREMKLHFIRKYIADEKKYSNYRAKQKAERQYEVLGLGYCDPAGIYGINLMDDIIRAYVDGHYVSCIALCRARTEIVLRERIYFDWFISNMANDIQSYIDKKLNSGDDEHWRWYVSFGVKYENLRNRLAYEFFEYQRGKIDSKVSNLKFGERKIIDLALGALISYCERKSTINIDKNLLIDLKKLKDDGNYFVHGHYLKPPEVKMSILNAKPNMLKDPKKSASEMIKLTTFVINELFGDYPRKTPHPKENLFKVNVNFPLSIH